MNKLLIAALFSALGFAMGWLANEWQHAGVSTDSYLDKDMAPSFDSGQESGLADQPLVSSGENLQTESTNANKQVSTVIRSQQSVNSAEQNQNQDSVLEKTTSLVEEFSAYIARDDFEQAVLFYGRHRHLVDIEPLMRSVLRNNLKNFATSGDTYRFSGLADAWLSSYYSDAEILLLVAKQHRALDHLQEALNILQLAITYSDGVEKNKAYMALADFIKDTDGTLSRERAWPRLQAFYEALRSMGLEKAEDNARLAEIYLFTGNVGEGRAILEKQRANSETRARAEAVLRRFENDAAAFEPQETRKEQFESRLAMRKVGHHYLLPLLTARGGKVNLMLDTGASTTLLSTRAFERFTANYPAQYLGPRIFNTANGLAKGHAYRIPSITFGPFQLSQLEVSVSDNDFGSEFDGLLGMNVLQQFTFQIDQDSSELLLSRRSGY